MLHPLFFHSDHFGHKSSDYYLGFYEIVRVEKGWVEYEFGLFIICCIAT